MPEDMEPVPTSSPKANRALKAIQLKEAGFEPEEIAETLGFESAEAAAKKLASDYKEIGKHAPLDKDAMRLMFQRRFDRLVKGLWAKAINPRHPEQMQAVQRIMQIADREIRMLGLDAPAEVDVTLSRSKEELAAIANAIIAVQNDLPEDEDDIMDAEMVLELEAEINDGAA